MMQHLPIVQEPRLPLFSQMVKIDGIENYSRGRALAANVFDHAAATIDSAEKKDAYRIATSLQKIFQRSVFRGRDADNVEIL
jgi:hypothetical protein